VKTTDTAWDALKADVERMAAEEAMIASYLYAAVLSHSSLEDALSYLLAEKPASPSISAMSLRETILGSLAASAEMRDAVRRDLSAFGIGKGIMIDHGTGVVIGDGSKIGAGSVVLKNVPTHTTVAGVPARIVGTPKTDKPSLLMDQSIEGKKEDPR
jgi:serine acetyltransferase